jgi:uncharacterized protein YdeI (YjbR/CyaY-like superfamily)
VAATSKTGSELPIILFDTPAAWATWLEENGAGAKGLWVRLAKKASGIPSIDYTQAVEVALCYGWIDGLKKSYDEKTWLQKFTPRTPKSIWSKINREKAQALIDSGKMRPAGLAAVEAAQRDGRWDAAYDSQSNATVPEDFQAALDANAEAKSFFATLNRVNRYAILFRIHQAKRAETRAKRIADFVAMLARHEKLHA